MDDGLFHYLGTMRTNAWNWREGSNGWKTEDVYDDRYFGILFGEPKNEMHRTFYEEIAYTNTDTAKYEYDSSELKLSDDSWNLVETLQSSDLYIESEGKMNKPDTTLRSVDRIYEPWAECTKIQPEVWLSTPAHLLSIF